MIIQEQALNYILETKDASFITENALNADYFYNYRDEFNFIKNYLSTYKTIPDKATFFDRFPNFDSLDVHESKQFLIDTLTSEKSKNEFKLALTKSAEIYGNSYEDAINYMEKSLVAIQNNRRLSSTNIITDLSRYDSYIDKSTNFNAYYVTTGFPELDEALGGGYDRKNEFTAIVARPGVGKSWILLVGATAAALKGLRVGIYSGEMSVEKVAYRFDTLVSHISNRDISHGNVIVQNQYKQHLDTLRERVPGDIILLTPYDIGDFATVTDLQAFIEREHLDMLFVDQHSLLKDKDKAKNAVERASNICKDLRALQALKQIPIISASQQNRDPARNGEEGPVDLDVSRIAQTDRIGQDCTLVLFLEQKDGILTFTIAKGRDGGTGKKFKYTVDYDLGKFEYIPMGDDNASNQRCDESQARFDSGEPFFDGETCF